MSIFGDIARILGREAKKKAKASPQEYTPPKRRAKKPSGPKFHARLRAAMRQVNLERLAENRARRMKAETCSFGS